MDSSYSEPGPKFPENRIVAIPQSIEPAVCFEGVGLTCNYVLEELSSLLPARPPTKFGAWRDSSHASDTVSLRPINGDSKRGPLSCDFPGKELAAANP